MKFNSRSIFWPGRRARTPADRNDRRLKCHAEFRFCIEETMHEFSIAMSIIEGATEEAQRHGCGKVHAVHLKLGALSGVDKDSLLFSYELACEGTALEGS